MTRPQRTKVFIITTLCLVAGAAIIVTIRAYQSPSSADRGHAGLPGNASSSIRTISADPQQSQEQRSAPSPVVPPPVFPKPEQTTFLEDFNATYSVREAVSANQSESPGWWLSSGAYFNSANGVGSTVQGSLSAIHPRRIAYSLSNPLDTDDGYHPQNIFRLVAMGNTWLDFQQEAYFKIVRINTSASPNRNASNGLLFFNRYQDASNLYYVGIRVDGTAIIKKKVNGTYYTMAYQPLYTADVPYDRDTNPNILPTLQWIGVRSEVKTNQDATLDLRLFIDNDRTGEWELVVEARDDGASYGGAAIAEGFAGIRTDFMDVEFDDYRIKKQ